MHEKTKALITLVILILTMINQALQLAGYSTIPFAPEKVEQCLSMLATAIVSVYAWWKNQNVSRKRRRCRRHSTIRSLQQAQGHLNHATLTGGLFFMHKKAPIRTLPIASSIVP